jgi:hypothetical protein
MRTKGLICAAALVASLASSSAQNVYSINVVGYVNYTLKKNALNMIANPLDATMGGTATGDLNNVTNLFQVSTITGTLAGGSYITTYVPSTGNWNPTSVSYNALTKKWSPAAGLAAKPGTGIMFYNNGASDVVVTYTGQIVQGSYNVATLAKNALNLVGPPVPIGGDLTNAVIGLVSAGGDYVSTYNPTTGGYNAASSYNALTKKWSPAQTINPGGGFFYYNNTGAAKTWTSNFTVN